MTASSKNVDFSNVKDGGNFNKSRIPAGDYLATITKVEDAESKSDGIFQYLFSIKINKRSSSVFPYYCKLQENQLWKLRNIFIAAGKTVPKRRQKVDPNGLIGRQIGVTIEDSDYDGKEQSEISGVFPAAELDEAPAPIEDDDEVTEDDDDVLEEDTDVEEAEDDAEDEPEEEADEFDGLEGVELRNAIKAAIKAIQPDFVAKKSQTNDDLRDLLTDARGDAPSDDDEDEEEEEEAPAPKPAAKRTSSRTAKKKPAEVTDEELEELDIDSL